eukprot:gene6602-13367_t
MYQLSALFKDYSLGKQQEYIDEMYKIVAPISLFWMSMSISQRIIGLPLLCLIPGRRAMSSLTGLCIVGTSTLISEIGYEKLAPYFVKNHNKHKNNLTKAHLINRVYISIATYWLLNQGDLFHTALPSSVTKLGVFSKTHLGAYVKASSEKTTAIQRLKIQKLGKVFGCHHCGSRQILSGASFIADHMPPSAIVESMNNNPIRKFFHLQIDQKLWPQCQSCFKVQSTAVKQHLKGLLLWQSRPLIYHHALKLHHFTYLLTRIIGDNDEIKKILKPIVDLSVTVI